MRAGYSDSSDRVGGVIFGNTEDGDKVMTTLVGLIICTFISAECIVSCEMVFVLKPYNF